MRNNAGQLYFRAGRLLGSGMRSSMPDLLLACRLRPHRQEPYSPGERLTSLPLPLAIKARQRKCGQEIAVETHLLAGEVRTCSSDPNHRGKVGKS